MSPYDRRKDSHFVHLSIQFIIITTTSVPVASTLSVMSSLSSTPSLMNSPTYWISDAFYSDPPPTAICFGTGRFLRSVLVPLLQNGKTTGKATTTAGTKNEEACSNSSNGIISSPVFLQTRGSSFVEYMKSRQESSLSSGSDCGNTYEVDTVLSTGTVETDLVACSAVFSLGKDKASVYSILLPSLLRRPSSSSSSDEFAAAIPIRIVGVGVTEGGMASPDTTAMQDLYELLEHLCRHKLQSPPANPDDSSKICIINTDNVPYNGDVLCSHMKCLASRKKSRDGESLDAAKPKTEQMLHFLDHSMAFLNSMVDRITSHRVDNVNVPRAEPMPAKALVILDTQNDLPESFIRQQQERGSGLVIRRTLLELQADIALKLRIANGTHTALAHFMALCGLTQTDSLSVTTSESALLLDCIDALVHHQIIPAAILGGFASNSNDDIDNAAMAVWEDWRNRLVHPHFGLSTFFITQNGAAKGGIRLGPTIHDLIMKNMTDSARTQESPGVTAIMALVFAVLLRWLTPATSSLGATKDADVAVHTGWLNGRFREEVAKVDSSSKESSDSVVSYADGLRYDLDKGWYEFRCACFVSSTELNGSGEISVSSWLGSYATPQQPKTYIPAIRAYLMVETGGDLRRLAGIDQFEAFVSAVATLYARMMSGDDLWALLKEFKEGDVFGAGMSHC